ncbi:zwei Ig domain protein zig-8-like isoform X2 [Babylonia areolata]|uniref:zwei Ig domain protein zig-8-like isoform X2 n=1 Tax=Babylonia areolata TaxID=304850 RepID=UPI003FD5C1EB
MRLAFFRLCQVLTAILATARMSSAAPLNAEKDGGEKGEKNLQGDHPVMPSFLPTPANVTFLSGEEAVLPCAIQNRGTRTVVWRRASDPNPLTIGEDTFVGDKRFVVRHRLHSLEWNLHIQRATPEDSGVYECHVITKSRDVRQLVLLHVDEIQYVPAHQPAIHISGPHYVEDGSHFVEKSNTLTLTCSATGFDYPPDDLDWFKDGLKLTNNGRLHLSKDVSLSEKTIVSTLQVSRAVMSDAGTYVCRASDMQVTSAKVNILNTESINSKRDSSNHSNAGPYGGHSSCVGALHVNVVSLMASLLVYVITS